MYSKLVLLSLAILAGAEKQYPPGVIPALCPNYPFCDNLGLTTFTPDGIPLGPWGHHWSLYPGYPFYPLPWPLPPTASPVPTLPASSYPLGVEPALCPYYPYCDVNKPVRYSPNGLPIPQWGWVPDLYAPPSSE